jgi:hypothetical protein
MALGVEKGDEKNDARGQYDRKRRVAPVRSVVPGPLYSLDVSEYESGSHQPA